MKRLLLFCVVMVFARFSYAQETFPVNGAWDVRPGQYAFTNATIVVSADQTITNGTLLVKDRTIEAVGQGITVPKGYVTVDLKGKYIYPGLVDAYTPYGIPTGAARAGAGGFGGGGGGRGGGGAARAGAFGWNEAIRPDSNARTVF